MNAKSNMTGVVHVVTKVNPAPNKQVHRDGREEIVNEAFYVFLCRMHGRASRVTETEENATCIVCIAAEDEPRERF